jgi:cellulose biosynthesis protein BcsQ
MVFPRSKKLVVANNKGGVGKTTLAFNMAVGFAKKGYKVVLVDLDTQCNLTRLALGEIYFGDSLLKGTLRTVYDVLRKVIDGGGDIDMSVRTMQLAHPIKNLTIIPGSPNLSFFEDLMISAYNQAAAGTPIGYFQTSAIDRYLRQLGIEEDVDIFLIDTSPNLGVLNQIIMLGTDYFLVPMAPDVFSVQGVENLGIMYEKWKKRWHITGDALAKVSGIDTGNVLSGEGLFIGYIVNSYNVYGRKPILEHRKWMKEIPGMVKTYLSEKHCRNGLVEKSWKNPLAIIQDYGQLPVIGQDHGIAISEIDPSTIKRLKKGTKENLEKSKQEFTALTDQVLAIVSDY